MRLPGVSGTISPTKLGEVRSEKEPSGGLDLWVPGVRVWIPKGATVIGQILMIL